MVLSSYPLPYRPQREPQKGCYPDSQDDLMNGHLNQPGLDRRGHIAECTFPIIRKYRVSFLSTAVTFSV